MISSLSCPEQMAFRYLSWLLYPLFGCYAVYSLLYVEHKGWYSFVLSMLYGFLLTFGKYMPRTKCCRENKIAVDSIGE